MDLCSSKSSSDEFSILQKIETPKMESSSADDSLVAEFTSSNECAAPFRKKILCQCRHAVKSVKPGRRSSSEIIKFWKENGFTNLIVAALELEVDRVIVDLLPLLSYSAPFAIYHQYLQPLATCMHKLQTSRMAVGLQISELWLREYQVLPSWTHPHMQMNAFGGYILSGVRICSSESGDANK